MTESQLNEACTRRDGPQAMTPQDGHMPASAVCGNCSHDPHTYGPCQTCRLIARVTRIERYFNVTDGNDPTSDVLRPLPLQMPLIRADGL